MIADDDRMQVRMVSNYLKQRGMECTLVHDGMQAMMFAVRIMRNVILLDINMPDGIGYEVLRKLKASTLNGQIPVIAVNGSIDPRGEGKVLEGRANAFLRKPVDMDKLYEVICQVLGGPLGSTECQSI